MKVIDKVNKGAGYKMNPYAAKKTLAPKSASPVKTRRTGASKAATMQPHAPNSSLRPQSAAPPSMATAVAQKTWARVCPPSANPKWAPEVTDLRNSFNPNAYTVERRQNKMQETIDEAANDRRSIALRRSESATRPQQLAAESEAQQYIE